MMELSIDNVAVVWYNVSRMRKETELENKEREMSKSVRVSDKSYQQLDELRASGYESLTNALSVAIDRLYRAEMPKEETMEVARHKSGNGTVVLKEADRGYVVTVHKEALPPHYSKLHDTMEEAAADFERLVRGKL